MTIIRLHFFLYFNINFLNQSTDKHPEDKRNHMDEFELELKNGFLEEAQQLLSDAEQCFLLLESNPTDTPTLEKIFRIAHNIKGSSKAVGFDSLGAFTHEFETFMLKCKSGQIPIYPSTVSLLLKCNDHIRQWLDALKSDFNAQLNNEDLITEIKNFEAKAEDSDSSSNTPTSEEPFDQISSEEVALVIESFESGSEGEITTSASIISAISDEFEKFESDAPTLEPTEANKTIEVSSPVETVTETEAVEVKLVEVKKVETPIETPTPIAVATPAPVIPPPANNKNQTPPVAQASGDESIRVSLARLEKLLNFVGEIVILQTVLKEQAFAGNPQVLRKTIQQMSKVTKEVQDISMSLRMVPLKQTFQKMQRIVRDTSSALNKKVQLVLEGEETEVDKTVLESLSDPLVHLIRNAVDHGIENPADRIQKGKSESGKIKLSAYHQSGKLVIEIKDDGGGIPADKLRQKAIEKGILKPGQTISDQDAIGLIFHAGFSTKAQVTEVSGRGVGMDVVKTNIEQMSGEVLVDTTLHEGSTFKVILPLTLAIIDGMIVRSGEERFVIPLAHVHESVKPEVEDLIQTTGVGEVLMLRGENLPVFRLSKYLGKNKKIAEGKSEKIAIIVRNGPKPFAAMVDDIIGQHQVVIKKLGNEIQEIKGYSGSAILGDGKPALILELSDLLSSKTPSSNPTRKAAA